MMEPAEDKQGGTGYPTRRSRLALILAVLGVWAAAVPWVADLVGLSVPVSRDVEIVDHVIPGLAVLLAAGIGWWVSARPSFAVTASWAGVSFLAGIWMTSTHVSLVADGIRGIVGWGESLIHSTPGVVVAVVSFVVLFRASGPEPSSGPTAAQDRPDRQQESGGGEA